MTVGVTFGARGEINIVLYDVYFSTYYVRSRTARHLIQLKLTVFDRGKKRCRSVRVKITKQLEVTDVGSNVLSTYIGI